jgi:hypothetical protein
MSFDGVVFGLGFLSGAAAVASIWIIVTTPRVHR